MLQVRPKIAHMLDSNKIAILLESSDKLISQKMDTIYELFIKDLELD